MENVKGLLGKNKWYLDSVEEQLQSLGYKITVLLLNAKNYLVPQNRERVFIIGTKTKFINSIPSQKIQITAGQALGNFAFEYDADSKFLTRDMDIYIQKYETASKCIVPRNLHLDRPSRTLTCRNLAGSTGDMLRICLPSGRRRRINHRESARLQSFPDWFDFTGTESSVFTQIGNAVPPMMAFHIARKMKAILDEDF